MKDKNPQNYNAIFICGLTLLFICLKLTNIIDWSWIKVLSPILAMIVIDIIIVIWIIKRR